MCIRDSFKSDALPRALRLHAIRPLADVVESVAADAERLLAAWRQLRLLVPSDVHGQRLTLRAHELIIATILIS